MTLTNLMAISPYGGSVPLGNLQRCQQRGKTEDKAPFTMTVKK